MMLTTKGTVSRDGLKKTTKEYRRRRRGPARVSTEERTEKYRKGQEVREDIRKERPEGKKSSSRQIRITFESVRST